MVCGSARFSLFTFHTHRMAYWQHPTGLMIHIQSSGVGELFLSVSSPTSSVDAYVWAGRPVPRPQCDLAGLSRPRVHAYATFASCTYVVEDGCGVASPNPRSRSRRRGRATAHRARTVLPVHHLSLSSQSQLLITLARPALAVRSRPARGRSTRLTGRPLDRLASLGLAYKFRATPTPALSGLSIARENPTKPSYQLGHLITRRRAQRGNLKTNSSTSSAFLLRHYYCYYYETHRELASFRDETS
jgi:hypothetical protein